MGALAVPRLIVSCESRFSLPMPSRGIPRPAESLRKTKESAVTACDRTRGLRLTTDSVGAPAPGGRTGRGGRTGLSPGPPPDATAAPPPPPTKAVALFSPFHEPPGCQPQPTPEHYDQLPR